MDQKSETGQNISQSENFRRSERIVSRSDGWLSPGGDYFKCGTDEHDLSADYLVTTAEYKQAQSKHPSLESEKKERNSRTKLEKAGYVLIRSGQLYNNGSSLTQEQLKKIAEARVVIINPRDGAKDCSPIIHNMVDKIKATDQFKQAKEAVKELGSDHATFETDTLGTVEKFARDLGQVIHTESIDWDEDELAKTKGSTSLPVKIFDILSEGYFEEMLVFNGRYKYAFRVVKLANGENMMVQKVKYNHDGLSAGLHGAVENWINIFVIDEGKIVKAMQKKITSQGTDDSGEHKIQINGLNGYFAKIVDSFPTRITDSLPVSITT